jgi:Tol biopolymer transport system component/DNA-binding winged helix-turn-helix (wHTH) protein
MHQKSSRVYTFGPYSLKPSEQQLERDGCVIPLTPKVFAILQVLVENAGHLVGRDELIRTVWPDTFVEEANLSRGISILRRALGDGTGDSRYIETVPKFGYRFVADVSACFVPAAHTEPAWMSSMAVNRAAERPARRHIRHGIRVAAVLALVLAGLGGLAYATWRLAWVRPPAIAHVAAPTHRQLTFSGTDASPAISPDGAFIAYVSDDPPSRHVMVRQVSGGQAITVATSTEASMLRWSPDGSQLMFFLRGPGRNGFYVAPRTGGSLRLITQGPLRSTWSPDGRTIATVQPFVGKVRLVDQQTGAIRTITLQGSHAWMWDVDWSPDGTRLVLVSQNPQGRFSVLTIQTDGSNQRTIVEDDAEIPSARWSRGGEAIYYSRRPDQTASIFKIRLPGAGLVGSSSPLVTGLESNGFFEVSADGDRLIYAREPYFSNLWLVDISRGSTAGLITTRQLTTGTSQVERPSISPDGASILFSRGGESQSHLYVLPLAGGRPRQLTSLNGFTVGGVWSPDGNQVAFISNDGGSRRVWIADANGTSLRAVSKGDVGDSFDLEWPHASRLYYQQSGHRDFYVLDTKMSRAETMLWQQGKPVGWVLAPVVSHDGSKVAVFWNNRKDGRGVWVLDTTTGAKTMIVSDKQGDAMPLAWSRDGKRLYLLGGERVAYRGLHAWLGETTKHTRVLSVPAASGSVTTVAEMPFTEVGGVSMTADGRRFVCAVYSSRSDVWVVDHFDPDVSRVAAK